MENPLNALSGLLGGLTGGNGGNPLDLLTNLTGGSNDSGDSSPLSLVSGLLSGLTGGAAGNPLGLLSNLTGGDDGSPLSLVTDLLGGLTGGAAGNPLSLVAGLLGGSGEAGAASVEASAASLPGLDTVTGLLGGGLPGLDAVTGLLGGGLPGLDALGGLTGGLGGSAINEVVSGTGDLGGVSSSPVGGLLSTLADATFSIPILGENLNAVLGQGIEGGSIANVLVTPLYGTPLFEPVQGLIGGNSVGEEIILYDVATRAVALTEGIPLVNDLARSALLGDLPSVTAFIGAYSGGLLSEDYLQFLVTEQGMLGSITNSIEGALTGLPVIGEFTDGKQLNALLDLVTGATDQILYVDDIMAGLLGGDQLSNELPFHQVLEATGLSNTLGGMLAPLGDVLLPALEPITNLVTEAPIAGPIALGTVGKLL